MWAIRWAVTRGENRRPRTKSRKAPRRHTRALRATGPQGGPGHDPDQPDAQHVHGLRNWWVTKGHWESCSYVTHRPARTLPTHGGTVADIEVPVLIVGGGPVGLCTSLLLSRFGVPSLLVERHPATSIHPRARGLNVRTMELLRTWGLEHEVRGAGRALENATDVVW